MAGVKKKKWIWLAAVVLIAAALAVVSKLTNNFLGSALHMAAAPVQSLIARASGGVQDFFVYAGNMKNFQQQNEELTVQNTELQKENRSVEDYKRENERLRRLLGIREELKEYETTAARVIGYEPNNWYDTIVINKGESSGIQAQDVVISDNGVVGQISEAGPNWARISTVINPSHALGVRITRTGDIGVLEGDSRLMKDSKCRLDYIGKDVSVVVGDILETSGIGGIFPPGLTVGKVTDITMDSTGRLTEAVVEPTTNLEQLHEVLVITEWEMAEQTPMPSSSPEPADDGGKEEDE